MLLLLDDDGPSFPRSLFAAGEQGIWLDASDFSTLFQDSAGTTPVTAVGQPVGLALDKRLGLALSANDFPVSTSTLTGWIAGANLTSVSSNGTGITFTGGGDIQFASTNWLRPTSSAAITRYAFYEIKIKARHISGAGDLQVGISYNKMRAITAASNGGVLTEYTVRGFADSSSWSNSFSVGAVAGGTWYIEDVRTYPINGNHAYQTTSASRPTVEALVNLLTRTEDFSISPWAVISGPVTRAKNTLTFTGQNQSVSQSVTTPAPVGASARFSVEVSGSGSVYIGVARNGGGTYEQTVLKVELTSTPTRYEAAHTIVNTGQVGFTGFIATSTDGTARVVTIDKADLRYVNTGTNLPEYQRVNSATDYVDVGAPRYLSFDGTDDGMATPSINFTGTDKMTVWAGVRKLSDAATGLVVELSAVATSNSGTFYISAPEAAGVNKFTLLSRGTVSSSAAVLSATYNAPVTAIVSGIGNISGDSAIIRVNGVQAASSTADQGTGNYGNYPLYIGRRAGTSLPFNGRIYQLIVRGAASNAGQIAATEAWCNSKTRAY